MQYADWKAPKADSQILIWPGADVLLAAAEQNRARIVRAASTIQNSSLADLSRIAREAVGVSDERLLIATGHQTELWHPGVWAKNAAIDRIARRCGGAAFHLAVDTDQPKHLDIRWPGASIAATDDVQLHSAAWAGNLRTPSPQHSARIREALSHSGLTHKPMLADWLDDLQAGGEFLAPAILHACGKLDASLGLKYDTHRLSPMLENAAWLGLVYHAMSHAQRFAADYNAALSAYREENGIKSVSRPMPDLVTTRQSVELPFWTDDLAAGRRHRMTVELRDGGVWFHVPYESDALAIDPAAPLEQAAEALRRFCTAHHLRIAPRALSLMLFTRLFLCDLFVHGIGGGRYDQITDRLIAAQFQVEPPQFAVSTATMFMPQALGREKACVRCVLQDGHRLKHGLLGPRKRELVGLIAAEPRRSSRRKQLYSQMQDELLRAAVQNPQMDRWRAVLDQTRRQQAADEVAFDREVFYAMQPRERLLGLIEQFAF